MTTAELKIDLLKLILETNDPAVLEEVAAYFHARLQKGDWWEQISEKEKETVQTGMRQLEEGQGIPYEAVREKARRLLKKP